MGFKIMLEEPIYQTQNGQSRPGVRLEGETVLAVAETYGLSGG